MGRIPKYRTLLPGFGLKQIMLLWLLEMVVVNFGVVFFFSIVCYLLETFSAATSWTALSVSLFGISSIPSIPTLDHSLMDNLSLKVVEDYFTFDKSTRIDLSEYVYKFHTSTKLLVSYLTILWSNYLMDHEYWANAWIEIEGLRYYLYPFYIIIAYTFQFGTDILVSVYRVSKYFLMEVAPLTQMGKNFVYLFDKILGAPYGHIKFYLTEVFPDTVFGGFIIRSFNKLVASPFNAVIKWLKRKFFGDDDGGNEFMDRFIDRYVKSNHNPTDIDGFTEIGFSDVKSKEPAFIEGSSKDLEFKGKSYTEFESKLKGKMATPRKNLMELAADRAKVLDLKHDVAFEGNNVLELSDNLDTDRTSSPVENDTLEVTNQWKNDSNDQTFYPESELPYETASDSESGSDTETVKDTGTVPETININDSTTTAKHDFSHIDAIEPTSTVTIFHYCIFVSVCSSTVFLLYSGVSYVILN